jgi:O-antigen/teichoic acid export membrane protein
MSSVAGQVPSTGSSGHAADARHAARSGAVQVLTILAQAVIAATQVVFARLYGQTAYGTYKATLAWIEMAARGGAAGADKSMLRYVAAARAAGDEEGVRRALGTGLRLCLGVATVGAMLLVASAGVLMARGDHSQAPALVLLAPVPILYGCLWVLIQATLAARVTRANFWVRGVFEPVALLVAGVLAWLLGGRLRALSLAHSLAATATFVVAVLVVRRIFRPAERHRVLSAPSIPGFARFSLFMGASELLNAILQRADIVIVNAFLGPETAAVYDASELITRVVANIRYAFDSIVTGMMSEALHLGDRERVRYNLRLTTRWVVTVAAPIAGGVMALRHELLVGLFSSGYAAGSSAMLVLAMAHLANASLGLTGWVLVAGGRSHLILVNNAFGVVFNVACGLILTPRFGIVGTTIGVLGAVLIVQGGAVIEVYAWQRIHPFAPALWKPVAAAGVAFAAELAVHAALPGVAWMRVVGVIATGVVTYFTVLVVLGLPPEERRMVDRLLARLRRV